MWLLAGAALLALATGAGCQDEAKADLSKITPEAREIFKTRCALCHGESGRGDGVNAATLNPKPRNYTDRAWQKRISNDEIKRTIIFGGAGTGKSPMMAPNPDLAQKPEVVEGLVAIVRSFGQQP
jgi:mono/diheme cytochrome c family protein